MPEYVDIVITAPPQYIDITAVIGGSGGGGAVDSVVGTSGRITVNNTDPENPVVNIDPAYDQAINDTFSFLATNKQNRVSQLVSGGQMTIIPTNTARVAAATTYFISGSGDLSSPQTDFALTLSASGNQRYVGFYGQVDGTVAKVEGSEAPLAVYPTQPNDTALFGYVLVGDASIGTTPDLSGYLLKSDKAVAAEVIAGTSDAKYVTPLGLKPALDLKAPIASPVFTGIVSAPIVQLTNQALGTAVAGRIEWLADKAYFTINTGISRKEITLNDGSLTSGFMPVASTDGRLINSGLTYTAGTSTLSKAGSLIISATGVANLFLNAAENIIIGGIFTVTPSTAIITADNCRLNLTNTATPTSWFSLKASTSVRSNISLLPGVDKTTGLANGDIWFNGTDLKMRVGGVTKTFTLI